MSELTPLTDTYPITVRAVRNSRRADWTVHEPPDAGPIAADEFVVALRAFFDGMDRQIDEHLHDPVATGQALARMDALHADMRYLRDRLNTVTANSMNGNDVRRLVIEGIGVLEASATVKRDQWRHDALMVAVVKAANVAVIDRDTGEVLEPGVFAERLLAVLTPSWKLTGLRPLGINPDDYCHVATDDNGDTISTPTVRIVDNKVRQWTAPQPTTTTTVKELNP
jgi:hypothetical protein